MKLDAAFVDELNAINPKGLMQLLQSENRPRFETYWTLKSEIVRGYTSPINTSSYLCSMAATSVSVS